MGNRVLLAAAPLLLCGCNLVLGSDEYAVRTDDGGGGAGASTGGGGATDDGGGAMGAGATEGGGGSGGAPPDLCDRPAEDKPLVSLEADVDASFTMTCDKTYVLVGERFVNAPAVLTIEAGTTIFGDLATGGVLVVMPGAKIEAEGTADRPIVFTSQGGAFADPGDWGGVILLGNAPINARDGNGDPVQKQIEGLVSPAFYGGSNANDSSGTLQYVRIEYGGTAIAPGNEVNGLTFGGVGRGTVVDHVMVRKTTDDCFEWFGGTVNATHLICQAPGDDAFDWDYGFTGKIQFAVLQQDLDPEVTVSNDTNGFEGDNDATGTSNAPLSEPTIYNVTLCGQDYAVGDQFGLVLRRATRGHIGNAFVSGFQGGLDLRNTVDAQLEIVGSIFYDNGVVAYAEVDGGTSLLADDDGGLDEVDWLTSAGNALDPSDPGIPGCDVMNQLLLKPVAAITDPAVVPPDDGFFDTSAEFVGAFRDAEDDWASGAWVRWTNN